MQDAPRALYYGGQWYTAHGDQVDRITSPSTSQELALVSRADAEDVDRAVRAAAAAFPAWRDMPAANRANLVRQAATRVRAHADELAMLDAQDSGNPVSAMLRDVGAGADYMDYFAGLITEMKGDTIPLDAETINITLREPLGVVARIMAFNHPLFYMTAKTASALVSGNTVVFKPSELTPLSALRIAELWDGLLPPGVFNLVTGDRETATALAGHPNVAKVGLIGSIGAGKAIMKIASGGLKRLTLELGGKNAFVACSDVDVKQVAAAVVLGMNFMSVAGQSCGSTSRVYLHETVHDAIVEEVVTIVSKIGVGLPTAPATEMGCLSSAHQYEKVLGYIQIARQEGATIACGGGRPKGPEFADGYFIEPTVLTDVTDNMRVAREEIFGPVVSILKWQDEGTLLSAVNALDVGLTAAVWSRGLDEALRLATRIQAGFVWINDSATHRVGIPFGGFRQSGFGREESIEEMIECTQAKTIQMKFKN
ncbi:aldehyde dehydrogenase family protein [Agrobacterium rhizogenes]|nr:aldehyde dehydrogenase family protein [Rhizobium rhizogenes]